MAEYRVAHGYRSEYHGFSEGDLVDVEDTVAAWVNRDSPGTLVAIGVEPEAVEPEASGDSEPPVEPEAVEPEVVETGHGGRKRGA